MDLNDMQAAGVAVMALAAVTLTAIAIVSGYKSSGALGTGATGNLTNASADKFLAGLAIFGTFMAVIVLAIVGKIIIGMFKKAD